MVTLRQEQIGLVEDFITDSFHTFEELREVLTNNDLKRVLTYGGGIEIVKPWECNIDLTLYNKVESSPLFIYDKYFKLVAIFPPSDSFGQVIPLDSNPATEPLIENIDHFRWLALQPHGSIYYLSFAIEGNQGVYNKQLMLLVCTKFYKELLNETIYRWLKILDREGGGLDLSAPSNQAYLNLAGTNFIRLYYFENVEYDVDLDLQTLIDAGTGFEYEIEFTDVLYLKVYQKGAYAIGLYNEGMNVLEWLRLDNFVGDGRLIYKSLGGLNFFFPITNTINTPVIDIGLNFNQIGSETTSPDFVLYADLVRTTDTIIINPIQQFGNLTRLTDTLILR